MYNFLFPVQINVYCSIIKCNIILIYLSKLKTHKCVSDHLDILKKIKKLIFYSYFSLSAYNRRQSEPFGLVQCVWCGLGAIRFLFHFYGFVVELKFNMPRPARCYPFFNQWLVKRQAFPFFCKQFGWIWILFPLCLLCRLPVKLR